MKHSVFLLIIVCLVFSSQTDNIICQDSSKISQEENEKQNTNPFEKKLADYTKIIDSDNVEAKLKALTEMFVLESKSTTPIVIKALKDKDSSVRAKAISLLERLRDKSANSAVMDVMFDTDENVRNAAAEYMGVQQVVESIPNLIKLLMDESRRVGERASYALYRIGKPAVPALIKALKHEDITVRKYACEALGMIKDKRAVQALIEATDEECKNDKDPNIRICAIRALGYIGDETAVDKISLFINDKDPYVHSEVINALGRIGGDKATTTLITEYKATKNTNILTTLGETRNNLATPVLLAALNHKDISVRMDASRALNMLNDPNSAKALLEHLNDTDKFVRKNVINTLINLEVDNIEKPLRDAFVKETDKDSKAFLANKLVYLNAYAGLEEEIVTTLVNNFPNSIYYSYYQSNNYLLPFGELASDALIKLLETTKDSEIERHIINLLKDFSGEKVVEAIGGRLLHKNNHIRYTALKGLGEISDELGLPYIEEYFNSEYFIANISYADTLFSIGGKKAVELLEKLFDKIGESQLKIKVASYLVRLRSDDSERFYNYLLDATKSWNRDIYQSVCWYLGDIGDNKAIPYIIEIIKTKPIETLSYAFRTLQEIGDKSVVLSLMKLFEDPKYALHKRAMLIKLRLCAGIVDKQNYINLLNEDDPYIRATALHALSKYEDVDLGPYNLKNLNSNNEQETIAALYFFGDTKDDKYIENIKPLVKSENDEIRKVAISAIGKICGTASELVLLNGLKDENEEIRHLSAIMIMRNKQKSAENILQLCFKEEYSNMVKVSIAGALYAINPEKYAEMGKFAATTRFRSYSNYRLNFWLIEELGLKNAVPTLIKELNSFDYSSRITSVQTLATLGDQSAIPALKEAFENSKTSCFKFVRDELVIALMKLGDKDGIKLSLNELQSTNNRTRRRAIETLGEYADASVIPELQKVMKEDYAFLVREAAKEAISKIQSRNK